MTNNCNNNNNNNCNNNNNNNELEFGPGGPCDAGPDGEPAAI
jgi:hypothetical protein